MFNKYNFKISKSDLKDLFKIVDDDKDGMMNKFDNSNSNINFINKDALNLKEFKKCALNQHANISKKLIIINN